VVIRDICSPGGAPDVMEEPCASSVRAAWSFQWPRGHICFRRLCRDTAVSLACGCDEGLVILQEWAVPIIQMLNGDVASVHQDQVCNDPGVALVSETAQVLCIDLRFIRDIRVLDPDKVYAHVQFDGLLILKTVEGRQGAPLIVTAQKCAAQKSYAVSPPLAAVFTKGRSSTSWRLGTPWSKPFS
jgi:hypothetical protein